MTKFSPKLFAHFVKARRNQLGIGIRIAAAEAGVSHSTISRIERGKEPTLTNFVKVCDWLGFGAAVFLISDDDDEAI